MSKRQDNKKAERIIYMQVRNLRVGRTIEANDAGLSYGVFRSKLTKIEAQLGKRFKVSCSELGELRIKRIK